MQTQEFRDLARELKDNLSRLQSKDKTGKAIGKK